MFGMGSSSSSSGFLPRRSDVGSVPDVGQMSDGGLVMAMLVRSEVELLLLPVALRSSGAMFSQPADFFSKRK